MFQIHHGVSYCFILPLIRLQSAVSEKGHVAVVVRENKVLLRINFYILKCNFDLIAHCHYEDNFPPRSICSLH